MSERLSRQIKSKGKKKPFDIAGIVIRYSGNGHSHLSYPLFDIAEFDCTLLHCLETILNHSSDKCRGTLTMAALSFTKSTDVHTIFIR